MIGDSGFFHSIPSFLISPPPNSSTSVQGKRKVKKKIEGWMSGWVNVKMKRGGSKVLKDNDNGK